MGFSNQNETINPITEDSLPDSIVTNTPIESSYQQEFIKVDDTRLISRTIPIESITIRSADFNNDSLLDLLNSGEPERTIFLGDGRNGFEPVEDSPFQFAAGCKNIVIGDFNGDGIQDAVVARYHDPEVMMIFGGRG